MNKKSDYYLFGIILLMIGIYSMLGQFVSRSFGFFAYLIVGAALLLLYHTKRKTWALFVGASITTIGVAKILPSDIFQANIIGAIVVLVISIVFLTLFYTKSLNGFLLPGCILFWIGLYMIISKFVSFTDRRGVLPMFIGFSFISAYKLGKNLLGRWSLFLGILITIASIFSILDLKLLDLLVFRGPVVLSVLLIIGSIFFIKKGINS